jgi:ATP-dependent DNA helicase RecG
MGVTSMNPDALRKLIDTGETLAVEFKGEERAPLNDRDLVETVVCLANRSGSDTGWLLIGVEDDGRITGARPRHGNGTDPNRLAALITARTRPGLSVQVHTVMLDGVPVLVIEVPPQRVPFATSEGVFLRRALGGDERLACLPMDAAAMHSLQADRVLLDPSAQIVVAADWRDLDPLEFERFRRSVRERRGRSDESLLELPDLELAKALGVVDANGEVQGIRLAALLLFGKEDALRRLVPTHEVAFQVLRGLEVETNDFFRWPLLRVMEEIEARIRARNRERELMVGLLRVGVPDYAERALREALANALIHRDSSVWERCIFNGTPTVSRSATQAACRKACGSTTCSSPHRARATRCSPMRSSVPASSSAPRAASIPSFTSSCATAARRPPMPAATPRRSLWPFPVAKRTSISTPPRHRSAKRPGARLG